LNLLDANEEFRKIFLSIQYGQTNVLEYVAGQEAEEICYALERLYRIKGRNSTLSELLLQTFAEKYRDGKFHNASDGIDEIINKLVTCYYYEPILQFQQ
jgi:hypothetical protein